MQTSNVCDLCMKDPIAFECGNIEGQKLDDIAYYHVIPRSCDDPSTLMSNGVFVFKLTMSKAHPILTDEAHVCEDCFCKLFLGKKAEDIL